MKSIKMIFLMAIIGMIITTSCSTENAEQLEVKNKKTTIKVLPNESNKNTLEFKFIRNEKGGLDFTNIEVLSSTSKNSDYVHCGGGVFTNGESTYMYIARDEGFPGAIAVFDEFIQETYYYTVHWCSCTCPNESYNKSTDETAFAPPC